MLTQNGKEIHIGLKDWPLKPKDAVEFNGSMLEIRCVELVAYADPENDRLGVTCMPVGQAAPVSEMEPRVTVNASNGSWDGLWYPMRKVMVYFNGPHFSGAISHVRNFS